MQGSCLYRISLFAFPHLHTHARTDRLKVRFTEGEGGLRRPWIRVIEDDLTSCRFFKIVQVAQILVLILGTGRQLRDSLFTDVIF